MTASVSALPRPRRLIICADGTWQTAEARAATNVVCVARAICPVARDGTAQFVIYHPGVGTGPFLDRLTGGAFGSGLATNVKDIYRALVYNVAQAGTDEVFLFGFSRGAYTVRSVVGWIRKTGLLRKEHANKLPEALALYQRRDLSPDTKEATDFRQQYSLPPFPIAFLGVWDTVGSLGIPLAGLRFLSRRKYQFHDVKLSAIVKRAHHALAVDEQRKPFRPTLWDSEPAKNQIVQQRWFPGVHCDVGGGYPDHQLSDAALAWLIESAEAAGLEFDSEYLGSILTPNPAVPLHDSFRGIYRLLGRYERPLGTDPGGSESASASAVARLANRLVRYAPMNLLRFLGTQPPTPALASVSQPPSHSEGVT